MFKKLVSCLLAIAVTLAASLPAAAMTVQPVVMNLSPGGRTMTQVITVTNTFTYPLAVELRTEELNVDETGVHATGQGSEDLLIFPPQALIQPGQTQSFRVQYVGDPDLARSKHYYVTVAQLPVQAAEGETAVQVLYNFQVLVSIAPQGGEPSIRVDAAAIVDSGDGHHLPVVTFSNAAAAHGFLSDGRIRIVQRDASGKETFSRTLNGPEVQQAIGYGLIGAGQTRQVTLPIELPSGDGTIEASFTADN